MPYVDISRDDDYVSLWYITNSPSGHASSFDPNKPTVLLLHPILLDSTWLGAQFGDPRLSRDYNLIAFDWRTNGKSMSRYCGKQDSWTDAVDMALFCYALCLPAAHVWASEVTSVDAAVRFSILFPELCLSLTLLSTNSLDEVFRAGDELLQMWAGADDIETLEFALFQMVSYIVGTDVDPDLADELIGYFETSYPPFRAARLSQVSNRLVHRYPLSQKEHAAVTVPCLLIHGDKNQIHPLSRAEATVADLVNAKGGAKLFVIKGGQGYISVVPQWASISNRIFAKFLASQPHVRTKLGTPAEPLDQRLRRALDYLAELAGDSTLADAKEPLSSMSFSRLSPSVQRTHLDLVKTWARKQKSAWSPLDSDGRPIRRYSERKHDHWFQGDRNGMSYAGDL
ncbi:alpha/beta-hydrolase [Vararia minispora EC-137]|uniref:Alpha/beta-hydrolase n=1 Tax=Vararia minispora EC-137 TaxID=1314806 RepID=A0ACB8QX68_9AGAM|nr:alpha/beta-hydrolase [Vararia minispora EC-137]